MRTYTIIGGVNGVGKSSFTGVLKERCTDLGTIIDVDKITAELGGNALAGGKAALKKINECIRKGVSFTQEAPLSEWHTEATAREVVEKGYIGYGCTISAWTAPLRALHGLPTSICIYRKRSVRKHGARQSGDFEKQLSVYLSFWIFGTWLRFPEFSAIP